MNFEFVISCLYFFLPAYFANMSPPILKRLGVFNFLAFPIDRNLKFFDKKPLLGSHKTLRGAFFGFLVSFLLVLLQRILFEIEFFKKISLIDYAKINIFLFATVFSFGVVFGDLFFAFIKRRLNLKEGAPFLPFDQTNYVLGCAFSLYLFKFPIKFEVWLFLFFVTFFLHIIVNRLGFYLKIHSAKW
jgi:CDP-2,3-bis-(O-geranylgeranyl)-sn-glycerol synthase